MSYILEALKRADAERDRGAVPTLHSHAIPAAADTRARPPVANWIAAVALLALVVLAALWWTLGRQPAPAGPATMAATAPATLPASTASAPISLTPVMPMPSPATPATPAVVAAAPAMPVAIPAPPVAAPPRPTAPSAPRKTVEPQRAAETPRQAASAVAAVRSPTPSPAQASSPATGASAAKGLIYNVADLPDDIRAQLPKLAISGITYSAQAAYRMLIVNGQVLHENDEPAPGLTLETIREKDMVLRFKGYRYSVGY